MSTLSRLKAKAELEENLDGLKESSSDQRDSARLQLLLRRLSSRSPLSPCSFFGVNHSGMLGAAATIITYMIVLMQFRAV